ncbi:MAG: glycosyltransferase family A protein [Gemmatimonadales bacterium]
MMPANGSATRPAHLVVVEAYDGLAECVSTDPDERRAARGLGLPLAELAEQLACRFTVLGWDEWLRYESVPGSFFEWMPFPATKARSSPGPAPEEDFGSPAVARRAVPARDPDHGNPLDTAPLSVLSHSLLAGSEPLVLLSYCLELELRRLRRDDPFEAVIVPSFGGLGYVAQLARATGAPDALDTPFVVVATDLSSERHRANQEGTWSRPALTRRQSETYSLALADLVLCFGDRGAMVARSCRLPGAQAPVAVHRRIDGGLLDRLERPVGRGGTTAATRLFLDEPQDPASGAQLLLDAVRLLDRAGRPLAHEVESTGAALAFAPMRPRTFPDYWSGRGWVRELIRDGRWRFGDAGGRGSDANLRLYPSRFEHLPAPWLELSHGGLVAVSAAAAEGLAPRERIPAELLLPTESVEALAERLALLAAINRSERERLRTGLIGAVLAAHRGEARRGAIAAAAERIRALWAQPGQPVDLGRVCQHLREGHPAAGDPPGHPGPPSDDRSTTLTAVVTCFDLDEVLLEAVESVWASERLPDELLLVDDGSTREGTLALIRALEARAATRDLPLTVIRQPNQGLSAARNAALARAGGELISFLDGDDLLEPAFYRVAVGLMARWPTLGGVASWARLFGEGMPEGYWNAPQSELPLLLVENTVIVPCVMRTAALRQLGGYDARQRYNYEDWELSLRLVGAGRPIVTVPRYLHRYRVRHDSLYRSMTPAQHQVMRERFLASHPELVERFAAPLALQLEAQLAATRFGSGASREEDSPAPAKGWRWLRQRLAALSRGGGS